MRTEIEQDLVGANMSDIADCLLRTEHLEVDMRGCLKKYERETGNVFTFDWTLFEELVRKKERNKSERKGSCEDFYDEETKKLVLTKDSHIVRLFGYDQCCTPSKTNKKNESPEAAEL